MTKLKINMLVSLSILGTYIFSCIFLFASEYKMQEKDFNDFSAYSQSAESKLKNLAIENKLNQQDIDILFCEESKGIFIGNEHTRRDNWNYPSFISAVFDKNGNIVASTTSFFTIEGNNTEFDEYVENFCMIGNYASQETIDEIYAFMKGRDDVVLQKLDYNVKDSRIIPVKLEIGDGEKYNKEFIVSNEKAEHHYERIDQYKDGYICILGSGTRYEKLYKMMYKLLPTFKDEAREVVLTYGNFEWGDYASSEKEQLEKTVGKVSKHIKMHVKIEPVTTSQINEEYAVVSINADNLFINTVYSEDFRSSLKLSFVLFSILLISTIIIASKIYDKNKRLEDSRKAFINAAAHELKTPLAVISNNCECALENVSPEKNESYVNTIYNESKRMTKLTQMLINYNKVMQRGSIKKAKADLSSIVQKECEKYKSVFESKNMNVQLNTVPAIIKCNEDLIALAVDNFLSNAAKYGKENTDVVVNVAKNKNSVRFSIYNESDPIPDEALPHIWEELYRVDKSRNSKDNSTGMGLAINRQIFEIHKFKYDCKNIKNGVEFSFKVQ